MSQIFAPHKPTLQNQNQKNALLLSNEADEGGNYEVQNTIRAFLSSTDSNAPTAVTISKMEI